MKIFQKKLTQTIKNNLIIKFCYKIKFYIDLSISQITWFTGKLPEIMAVLYLAEKFGFVITGKMLIVICLAGIGGLIVVGYIWKNAGLYDVDQFVKASKDPVQKELLSAARKINGGKNVE